MNKLSSVGVFSCLALSSLSPVFGTIYEGWWGNYVSVYDDTNQYNWYEALAYCEEHYQTSLATIHSSNDEDACNNARYTIFQEAWIGLNDREIEGTWQWADGSNYDFNVSWGPGEPNDYDYNEDCVQFIVYVEEGSQMYNDTAPTVLNDLPCYNSYHQFICNSPNSNNVENDKDVENDTDDITENVLFIPLMVVSGALGLVILILILWIIYFLTCFRRKPKFEMLTDAEQTKNTDSQRVVGMDANYNENENENENESENRNENDDDLINSHRKNSDKDNVSDEA